MNKKTSAAFTLIELLTVIAIIGILAAILIPVVGSVREGARDAKCKSNLRELGMAARLWENDNDHLPWGIFPSDWKHGETWWGWYLTEYIYDTEGGPAMNPLLQCPSIQNPGDSPGNYVSTYPANRLIFVVGQLGDRRSVGTVRSEQIERPTEVILFGDGEQRELPGGSNSTFNALGITPPSNGNPRNADEPLENPPRNKDGEGSTAPRYRHNDKANFVFVDGHVESISLGEGGLKNRNYYINY